MDSPAFGPLPTIKCEDPSPPHLDSSPHHLVLSPHHLASSPNHLAPSPSQTGEMSLSVNLSAAVFNLLTADSATPALRTPEIVNDLITLTNPLDQYGYSERSNASKSGAGCDSNSSMSSSSAASPAAATPPSIQKTCSELIKAGLKLSIESKRKLSGSEEGVLKRPKREDSDEDYDSSHTHSVKNEGLTPEDEERRRRRRERNKIAATKCRMKKRERTVNLVTESEVLETQNIDLKTQLKELEVQRRRLIDMLSLHTASCVKNNPSRTSPSTTYPRPYETSTFPTTFDISSPYIRPESANILTSSYTCVTTNGDSSLDAIPSIDNPYMNPQMVEDYPRADSVLSLPPNSEATYLIQENFMPKANLLVPIDSEQEYYDPECTYAITQYPITVPDSQAINNGLNDGCLV